MPGSALSKPRVLLFITELDRGGAERMVTDLARLLDRSEFDVTVGTVWSGGALATEIAESGTPVLALRRERSSDPRLVWSFARLLLANRFDIVHSNLPLAGLIARAGSRFPHSTPDVYTEHNLPATYATAARWLNCLTLRLPTQVVAVSAEVEQAWARVSCGRPRPATVVHNGVVVPDEARAPGARIKVRQELRLPADAPMILTVANLFARKGHAVLLKAFAAVRTPPDAYLVLVGDGPLRDELRLLSRDLGVESRTRFVGARSDVGAFLDAADVFVLPSLAEGLPLALLEAMAHELACVASHVGGVPEVIVNEESGLLVEAGDAEQVCAMVERLLSTPDLRLALGRAARSRVRSRFSAAAMARSYEALYRAAIARSSRGSTPRST